MRASTLARFNADTPMFPMFADEAAQEKAAAAQAKADKARQRRETVTAWAGNFGRMDNETVPRDFC